MGTIFENTRIEQTFEHNLQRPKRVTHAIMQCMSSPHVVQMSTGTYTSMFVRLGTRGLSLCQA